MAKAPKKSIMASFVEGKNGKRVAPSKSLTPKVKASDDKKRMGTFGKIGPY